MRILILGLCLLIAPLANAQSTMLRPVAVVNDSAITGFDIDQRVRLMRVLGFPAASNEALREEALRRLVDDRLKIEAGDRLGLRMNNEALNAGFSELAERVGARPDEFEALLINQQITRQAVDDFVGASVVWNEVVRARFASRIEPGEAEIDAEIQLRGGGGREDYRLQEIGLPMTGDGRTEAQTRALADRLRSEIAQGADFAAAARQYSSAPTAEAGGEVGWVSSATLPPELAERLSRLQPGEISDAIPVPGGLSLIRLLDRRSSSGSGAVGDPAVREQIRREIVEEQSSRLAEGLLQELRRDALIEFRQ